MNDALHKVRDDSVRHRVVSIPRTEQANEPEP
jgi:hypothetical protein